MSCDQQTILQCKLDRKCGDHRSRGASCFYRFQRLPCISHTVPQQVIGQLEIVHAEDFEELSIVAHVLCSCPVLQPGKVRILVHQHIVRNSQNFLLAQLETVLPLCSEISI